MLFLSLAIGDVSLRSIVASVTYFSLFRDRILEWRSKLIFARFSSFFAQKWLVSAFSNVFYVLSNCLVVLDLQKTIFRPIFRLKIFLNFFEKFLTFSS